MCRNVRKMCRNHGTPPKTSMFWSFSRTLPVSALLMQETISNWNDCFFSLKIFLKPICNSDVKNKLRLNKKQAEIFKCTEIEKIYTTCKFLKENVSSYLWNKLCCKFFKCLTWRDFSTKTSWFENRKCCKLAETCQNDPKFSGNDFNTVAELSRKFRLTSPCFGTLQQV